MNVEIGTEAAQFIEKEYINGIFATVYCTSGRWSGHFLPCYELATWHPFNRRGHWTYVFCYSLLTNRELPHTRKIAHHIGIETFGLCSIFKDSPEKSLYTVFWSLCFALNSLTSFIWACIATSLLTYCIFLYTLAISLDFSLVPLLGPQSINPCLYHAPGGLLRPSTNKHTLCENSQVQEYCIARNFYCNLLINTLMVVG